MKFLTIFMARDIDVFSAFINIFSAGCEVGIDNFFFRLYYELGNFRREGKIDEKQFDILVEKLREIHQDIKKKYCELEKAIGD
jgi:hypothetical protein